MGTPEFAVGTLEALDAAGYEIVGVVTAPDRPAGRGRQLKQPPVKRVAESRGIPVLQPVNLKSKSFLKALAALNANLQIVVAFRMLPEVVWQMPEYGTVNLHASLLPDYRGAAPINWVLINGEKVTGVTTFFIDEKIDTGELILQQEVTIAEDENAGSLHDKLMEIGAKLVVDTVELIAQDKVVTRVQPAHNGFKSAPKLTTDTCRIAWNQPGRNIVNHIRGLSPYPGAWTILVNGAENLHLKIFEAEFEKRKHHAEVGTVFSDKKRFSITVPDGVIHLLSVQFPGKSRLPIRDVLNGLRMDQNSYVR